MRFLCAFICFFLITAPCYGRAVSKKNFTSNPGEYQGTTFLEEVKYGFSETTRKIIRDLHPYVRIEEEFDDNIFRTHSGKKWDFITRIRPGIKYDFKPAVLNKSKLLSSLQIDFGGEFEYYARHKNENHAGKLEMSGSCDGKK